MTNFLAAVAGIALIAAATALPAYSMSDEDYQARTDEINQRYQIVYDSAEHQSKDLERDSKTCLFELGFDAEWGPTKIAFDVPVVTFHVKEMKFHFVKTYFNVKTIASFDIPKTRWEIKKIGFGIKTKVPVFYKDRVEIKTKVPEFIWDLTSIKTRIPEFYSKRVEIKFDMLKIKKLNSASTGCSEEQRKGEALSASLESTGAAHKAELVGLANTQLDDKLAELDATIVNVNGQFDEAANGLAAAINEARANGIDPAAVSTVIDGQTVTLLQAGEAVETSRQEILASLEAAKAEINKAKLEIANEA